MLVSLTQVSRSHSADSNVSIVPLLDPKFGFLFEVSGMRVGDTKDRESLYS